MMRSLSKLKTRTQHDVRDRPPKHVLPFLPQHGRGRQTAHANPRRARASPFDASRLLAKVVDLLAEIPMEDRDTKGDLYEYMRSKDLRRWPEGQFSSRRATASR